MATNANNNTPAPRTHGRLKVAADVVVNGRTYALAFSTRLRQLRKDAPERAAQAIDDVIVVNPLCRVEEAARAAALLASKLWRGEPDPAVTRDEAAAACHTRHGACAGRIPVGDAWVDLIVARLNGSTYAPGEFCLCGLRGELRVASKGMPHVVRSAIAGTDAAWCLAVRSRPDAERLDAGEMDGLASDFAEAVRKITGGYVAPSAAAPPPPPAEETVQIGPYAYRVIWTDEKPAHGGRTYASVADPVARTIHVWRGDGGLSSELRLERAVSDERQALLEVWAEDLDEDWWKRGGADEDGGQQA
jgi:hypothetical protein